MTSPRVNRDDLPSIARGAAILGTGGGGDPHIGSLLADEAIRRNRDVPLVKLSTLDASAVVIPVAMMGAPTVMVEKLPAAGQVGRAVTALADHLERAPTHIACIEAGGVNSMLPFVAAAELGLPVVDADGMGRAFPELQMIMPTLYGVSASPVAVVDDKGNEAIFTTTNNQWAEQLARSAIIEMGCAGIVALCAVDGGQMRAAFVGETLSMCARLGRAVDKARRDHENVVHAVTRVMHGVVLHNGKVSDVERTTTRGFARGVATIEGLDSSHGRTVTVEFQNENLIARCGGKILVTVPDLIVLLDSETGEPVTTEGLQFGHRVSVIAAPCDERWHSPAGLELVGPRYFGYDTGPVRYDSSARQHRSLGAGR